jgi:hypothetical protein
MSILHASRPRVQKTRVLFDATKYRRTPARFAAGLIDVRELLRQPSDTEIAEVFATSEAPEGPEPEFASDSEARAYEAGLRIGRARIDCDKVKFSGWSDEAQSWFWAGFRHGWSMEEQRRADEQAEVDRRFDSMYAESLRHGDDGCFGYE